MASRRGSGRPGRSRQGRSQPRPRAEPVGSGWACGRRPGGARAGCGRERGHCVPHPPTPGGVMARARFLRHLSGHSALAPRPPGGVDGGTPLPFLAARVSPHPGHSFLRTQLSLWGTRGKAAAGMGAFPVLPARPGEVRGAWSVGPSLVTCVRVRGRRRRPLSPERARLTFLHPTPPRSPFPALVAPMSSAAGHVFAFPALLRLRLRFPEFR